MEKIKRYFSDEIINKETFAYMIWGGMTAFMTVVLYFVFVNTIFGVALSNTVANVIGITASYYTQKRYVFDTSYKTAEEAKKEIIKFFISRIGTFILETVLLVVLVHVFGFDKNIMKIVTSFITVVLNYFIAKIIIFAKI